MASWTPPPSARVTGLRQTRIVWNRDAVGAMVLGMADAVSEIMYKIVDDASANAPKDAEIAAKRGVPMLKDTGRVAVYAGGVNKSGKAASLLMSGTTARTQAANKPRGASTPADQVVGFAMFDTPIAHLLELGTVNMVARPFLIPAFNRNIGGLAGIVPVAIGKRVAGSPASIWARQPTKQPPATSETLAAVLRAAAGKI